MKLKLFFILIYITTSLWSISSDEILSKINTKYKNITTFTADYRQIDYLELADKKTETIGRIYLGKGDLFRIENGNDFIFSNNKTIWRYSEMNKQVLIENIKEGEDTFLPGKLLFEFGSKYKVTDYFEKKVNGKKEYVLSMTSPKGEEKFINKLKVTVNSDFIPYKIDSEDIDENKRTFILNNIKLGTKISENKFKFIKIPGVEIIDLRK